MNCDIKIMASPKRRDFVMKMCEALNLDISKDVFFDDRPCGGNAAYTSKKTWALPFENENITHRCVLQDDVLTCENFHAAINGLVTRFPMAVFSLFCPSAKMIDIKRRFGEEQIVNIKKCGVYGPAIIVPRKIVSDVYKWGEQIAKKENAVVSHDDVLFGEYALAHQMNVYTTIPSLVQHLCPTESLLGYNRKEKVSKVFDAKAGNCNWSIAKSEASITIPNSMKFYKATRR